MGMGTRRTLAMSSAGRFESDILHHYKEIYMNEQLYIWDGKKNPRKRKAVKIECSYCGEKFIRAKRFVKEKNYCCREHANKGQQKQVEVECSYCGKKKQIKQYRWDNCKTGHFFCNRECQSKAQEFDSGVNYFCNFIDGLHSYRARAFKYYPHECTNCGYDEVIPALDVHHIDSNRNNNELSNLIILCRNCHGLLTLKLGTLNEDRKIIVW